MFRLLIFEWARAGENLVVDKVFLSQNYRVPLEITIIFALEATLLEQIFVLRKLNFYCLNKNLELALVRDLHGHVDCEHMNLRI